MSSVSSQNPEYASFYTLVTTACIHSVKLNEAVKKALPTYEMLVSMKSRK